MNPENESIIDDILRQIKDEGKKSIIIVSNSCDSELIQKVVEIMNENGITVATIIDTEGYTKMCHTSGDLTVSTDKKILDMHIPNKNRYIEKQKKPHLQRKWYEQNKRMRIK